MTVKRKAKNAAKEVVATHDDKRLFADLRELVLSAKRRVAATVNSEIVMLYW